jgi:DNA-binding transcriptional ArsR family regulator
MNDQALSPLATDESIRASEIDELQASILRSIASAQRLRVIHALGEGPREPHELAEALSLGQAATSQHLAALRATGAVEATRDGRTVTYRLADPDILRACLLMRAVLVRRLTRLGRVAAAAAGSQTPSIGAGAS